MQVAWSWSWSWYAILIMYHEEELGTDCRLIRKENSHCFGLARKQQARYLKRGAEAPSSHETIFIFKYRTLQSHETIGLVAKFLSV